MLYDEIGFPFAIISFHNNFFYILFLFIEVKLFSLSITIIIKKNSGGSSEMAVVVFKVDLNEQWAIKGVDLFKY